MWAVISHYNHYKITRKGTGWVSCAFRTITKLPMLYPTIPLSQYYQIYVFSIIFYVKTKLSRPPRRSVRYSITYYPQRGQWVLRPANNIAQNQKEIALVGRHQPLQPLQNTKKWHIRGVMRLQNHYKAANAVSHYSTIPILPNLHFYNHFKCNNKAF